MAEKLDVQELVRTWERLGPLAGDPQAHSPEFLAELEGFIFRMASALPELARVHQQHDDAMRTALFVCQQGYSLSVEIKEGFAHDTDKMARAYIARARKFGWKPPRECD